MNGVTMNKRKSIWAIFAGFLTVVLLSTGTDFILEKTGIFTPPEQGFFTTWMMVLAFAYRSVYTIAGGYVTASLAPQNPMRHVVILGCIGTAAGIAGVFIGWNLSDHWYPIALAATGFLFTWVGGKIKTRNSQTT